MFQGSTLGGGDFETGFGEVETGFGAIDWQSIIDKAFNFGSQAVSAYSGSNSGTQIGYNAQGGVFAIQPSGAGGGVDGGTRYASQPAYTAAQLAAMRQAGGGAGATVGGGVDGIFNWLMANPLITFGGIAGIYLLMKEPPRRR